MVNECPREHDVLGAIVEGRWSDDLRAHTDGCPVCAELALVAAAIGEERDDACLEARVPTPGQVWWRATMRRRAEAAAAAARPITMAQGVAGACAAGFAAALITLGWPTLQQQLSALGDPLLRGGERLGAAALEAAAAGQPLLPLALLLGACLLLTPFVLYAVLSDD